MMMVNNVKYQAYTKEIKNRSLYIVMSFFLSLSISYYKATQLLYLFVLSCGIDNSFDSTYCFIFTDVREAFSATLLVCLVFSIFSFSLLVMYSFMCFFLPSWFSYERKSKVLLVYSLYFSCVWYIVWIHSFIIPKVCGFFFAFQVQNINCFSITVEPRIYSYTVWGSWFLFFALFVFLFVCTLLFLIVKGNVNLSYWSKNRQTRFFGCTLLAALLSPPEILTQSILCLLLFVLFELIVFFAFVHNKFTNKKLKS